MAPGSVVIYLADPLNLGKMLILEAQDDGMVLCECVHPDERGEFYRDRFHVQELELFEIWDRRPVT